MKNAILIPLYRPDGKQLLLLKSVISRCADAEAFVVHAVADGPDSGVVWPEGAILGLLEVAARHNIELLIYSCREASGYPGCYQNLIRGALSDHEVGVVHFVDQDDYCLPGRFGGRSRSLLQASGALVSDSRFGPLAEHRFDTMALAAALETPSLGMTFSLPRELALEYVELCQASRAVAKVPHDFVMAQMAIQKGRMAAVSGNGMIYIQHGGNTIGYGRGWGRIFKWMRHAGAVSSQLKRHARVLDLLYGGDSWLAMPRLHRNPVRSALYRIALRMMPR